MNPPARQGHPASVTVIEPGGAGLLASLRESWAAREVLLFLAWRDVKVRYRQTLLGVAWIVLQPLLTLALFSLVLANLPGASPKAVPYVVWAYVGLWLWAFLASALTSAATSLVNQTALVTKVYFPRLLLPAAAIASRLPDLLLGLPVLALLAVHNGVGIGWWRFLLFLVFPAATAALSLGLGAGLAAVMARFRDVGQALPFLLQIAFFATPVAYARGVFPEPWRSALRYNPLTGLLEGGRAVLFGEAPDALALAVSGIFIVVSLMVGGRLFRRAERSIVDVL
jgi:lipopolysaccharide transport system permease protein